MTAQNATYTKPFDLFAEWMKEAEANEPNDPNAMALATVDAEGRPGLRMVLLKGWAEDGFRFFTNLTSRKGRDLAENQNVALLFHWKSLRRQIRIEGSVSPVTTEEADEYFASRPRGSRIGAWASKQSAPMEGRFEFEGRIAKYTAEYAVGEIPRPDFWSGYLVTPKRFEFWMDRPFRLHDRHQYDLADDGKGWTVTTLYP
ncbi:pyridoxamine 5'-phosphate oxidase [Pseudokordiimonas caeni]|uniref:pyridoxamine 5'-phosphate oxidase n=1 Tax=Pseudokordiimonas caeni TaxID=2997908 RepID=UPI002811130E|nr:pyridoxamine 5'-phosphate oxidase [Pseudokordiimonas caeni]